MNWIIENTLINQSNNKGIKLNSNSAFDTFFDCFVLYDWYTVINMSIEEGGHNYQGVVSIIYFNTLDWYDINVIGINFPEDCVMARFTLPNLTPEESIMNKVDFEKMLLEFSKKLLEIHFNNTSLPENWVEKMEMGILNLQNKLSSYPPNTTIS